MTMTPDMRIAEIDFDVYSISRAILAEKRRPIFINAEGLLGPELYS